MKKFVSLLVFCALASTAWGETVVLKNGTTTAGTIVERTADSIKLDVSGLPVTYYKDEIGTVDGVAFADLPAVVAAPAAAPQAAAPAPVAEAPVAVAAQPAVAAAEPVVTPLPIKEVSEEELVKMDKTQLILKFVEVFGTKDSMEKNFAMMAANLPPAEGEAFRNAFKVDNIVKELVPLYGKYFTEEDLKGLIRFYTSPAGRKLTGAIPSIMKDSVEISAKYFEANMPDILKNYKPGQQAAGEAAPAAVVPEAPAAAPAK
ncbi:MAG: DUF2059 domain-containing protein [Candidatus Omnitrophica bacterium]|nr:DUF2059 domain-containing protein [Candidatus Omnitrophota bacterium]